MSRVVERGTTLDARGIRSTNRQSTSCTEGQINGVLIVSTGGIILCETISSNREAVFPSDVDLNTWCELNETKSFCQHHHCFVCWHSYEYLDVSIFLQTNLVPTRSHQHPSTLLGRDCGSGCPNKQHHISSRSISDPAKTAQSRKHRGFNNKHEFNLAQICHPSTAKSSNSKSRFGVVTCVKF